MNKSELIQQCLNGDTEGSITGSDILTYVKSPFITYCNSFVDEKERDPPSSYLEFLRVEGIEHEAKVISEEFPDTEVMEFEDQIDGFKQAINAMYNGAEMISNVPLLYLADNNVGRADLIIKDQSHSSIFGNFHYVINEIKLAKNIKKYHIYQAIYYNKILGKIQNYTPKEVFLVNNEGEKYSFEYEEYVNNLNEILKDINLIRHKKKIPPPVYNGVDHPWTTYSNKEALENGHLSCIVNLGSKLQKKLNNAGFYTIEDLHYAKMSDLTAIKGIGRKSATQFKNYAKALIEDCKFKIEDSQIEHKNIELFIDFEGVDPTLAPDEIGSYDFLFGVIIRNRNEDTTDYRPFFIDDPINKSEVEEVFSEFISLLKSYENAPIYHWHHYEKTRINKYYDMLSIPNPDQILSNLIDLNKEVKNCWVLPIPSLSLKEVAPYLGFSWHQHDFDGREAIVKYITLQKYPFRYDELKNEILEYNEDDIRAVIHVLDTLF